MMVVNIMIRGVENAARFLKKERARIEKEANEGVLQAAMFLKGEVVQSIAGHRAEKGFFIKTKRGHTNEGPGIVNNSVDTGHFMQNIYSKASNGVGYVYTNVKYAAHLEYGTSRMAPRYHFRNSLERNRKEIRDIIAKRIGDNFKSVTGGLQKSWYKPVTKISDVINI